MSHYTTTSATETIVEPAEPADIPLQKTDAWYVVTSPEEHEKARVCIDLDEHPQQANTIKCRPLDFPSEWQHGDLEWIERVDVIEAPVADDPEEPHEVARALQQLAEELPELIPLPAIGRLLSRYQGEELNDGNEELRLYALQALQAVACEYPEACAEYLPNVEQCLTDQSLSVRAVKELFVLLDMLEDTDEYDIKPVMREQMNQQRSFGAATETNGEITDGEKPDEFNANILAMEDGAVLRIETKDGVVAWIWTDEPGNDLLMIKDGLHLKINKEQAEYAANHPDTTWEMRTLKESPFYEIVKKGHYPEL